MNRDRLSIREIRETGHCVRGIRDWLTTRGFDFKDVVKNGISIKDIERQDDEIGRQVIAKALENRRKDS